VCVLRLEACPCIDLTAGLHYHYYPPPPPLPLRCLPSPSITISHHHFQSLSCLAMLPDNQVPRPSEDYPACRCGWAACRCAACGCEWAALRTAHRRQVQFRRMRLPSASHVQQQSCFMAWCCCPCFTSAGIVSRSQTFSPFFFWGVPASYILRRIYSPTLNARTSDGEPVQSDGRCWF
jgi:hypothetical protein